MQKKKKNKPKLTISAHTFSGRYLQCWQINSWKQWFTVIFTKIFFQKDKIPNRSNFTSSLPVHCYYQYHIIFYSYTTEVAQNTMDTKTIK